MGYLYGYCHHGYCHRNEKILVVKAGISGERNNKQGKYPVTAGSLLTTLLLNVFVL